MSLVAGSMAGLRRIPDAVLSPMLGRLAVAVSAGIDLRRAWESESGRVPARCRRAMRVVSAGLRGGRELAEAMADAGAAFPAVVRGMIHVGDRTGRLAEVLRDTANAIDESLQSRRKIRRELLGPAVQLAVAAGAVGLLIFVSGMARSLDGEPLDFLGLGLTGGRGLTLYLLGLAAAIGVTAGVAPVVARSWRARGWARMIGGRLPVLGNAIMSLEAAAWCRAASLAAHAGMSAGELVSLASSAAPGLAMNPTEIESRLRRGDDLTAAVSASGALPRAVVEAVGVGELTGTTAEALDRVAEQLAAAARRGFAAAVKGVGFAVWTGVVCLIVLLVLRLMTTYVGIIQDAARPL